MELLRWRRVRQGSTAHLKVEQLSSCITLMITAGLSAVQCKPIVIFRHLTFYPKVCIFLVQMLVFFHNPVNLNYTSLIY